jgi:hypothetical protein
VSVAVAGLQCGSVAVAGWQCGGVAVAGWQWQWDGLWQC